MNETRDVRQKWLGIVLIIFIELLGLILIALVISTVGFQSLVKAWWGQYSWYIIGGSLAGGAILFFWTLQIKAKYLPPGSSMEDYLSSQETDSGQDLMPLTCPDCEATGYYFSPAYDFDTALICWKCGCHFSQVWCDACGMGGDFVEGMDERPADWICPGCKREYSLPVGYYENPVRLISWENLDQDVQNSERAQLMRNRIRDARVTILGLGTIGLTFTLMDPLLEGLQQTLEIIDLVSSEALKILILIVGMLLLFVSIWWGMIFFGAFLWKGVERLRGN
jgi:hypothetical protein